MSDSIPKVSIVIPHWNNVEILSECLKSIGSTIYPDFEVIVVDNASTDKTVSNVSELINEYPHIGLIVNNRNFGQLRSPFHALTLAESDAILKSLSKTSSRVSLS